MEEDRLQLHKFVKDMKFLRNFCVTPYMNFNFPSMVNTMLKRFKFSPSAILVTIVSSELIAMQTIKQFRLVIEWKHALMKPFTSNEALPKTVHIKICICFLTKRVSKLAYKEDVNQNLNESGLRSSRTRNKFVNL